MRHFRTFAFGPERAPARWPGEALSCRLGDSAFWHDLRMAYQLDYFFDRGSMTSEMLLGGLLRGLRDLDVDPSTVKGGRGADWPEGLDWVSGELTAHGQRTGIHVEIHADDESVDASWEGVSGSPGAPPRPEALGVCILTLSGEVDRKVFEKVRILLRDQWSAAEHDQMDGFSLS
jgi:hypothetical protein